MNEESRREKIRWVGKAGSFRDLWDTARAGLISKGVGYPLGDCKRETDMIWFTVSKVY